jgi:molybdopterin converting factor subunit 1
VSATVTVEYFALLREERGLESEEVETEARTPGELYEELRARHGFRLSSAQVRVALGDTFAPMDAPLESGARLVFIPPVAGG